jgi:hypothetical protein
MKNFSENTASSVLSHHGEFAPIQIIKATGDAPLLFIMETYFNIYLDSNFKNPNYIFPNEEFKPIPNYEGLYSISNVGRVRSEKRLKWNGQGYVQLKETIPCHVLEKSHKKHPGYYSVSIWKNNQRKRFHIHRLVMIVFNGGIPNETVNHKNGIKVHNFPSNLEWATIRKNNQHAFENGLMNPVKGIDNYWAKLTDEKVREIRLLLLKGISQRKIANQYGISRGPIQRIAESTGWKHVK